MMTFNQYLRQQRRRDDAVGDLARDFIRDRDYSLGADVPAKPRGNPRFKTWHRYFTDRGASEGALRAFCRAYQEYLGNEVHLLQMEAAETKALSLISGDDADLTRLSETIGRTRQTLRRIEKAR